MLNKATKRIFIAVGGAIAAVATGIAGKALYDKKKTRDKEHSLPDKPNESIFNHQRKPSKLEQYLVQFFEEILGLFRKGRICILGERSTGKTTLLRFISTGILSNVYKPTGHATADNNLSINLKDLDIKFSKPFLRKKDLKGRDISGSKEAYLDWKDAYFDSDYILYFLRADLLYPTDLPDVIRFLRQEGKEKKYKQFIEYFNGFLDSEEVKRMIRVNSSDAVINDMTPSYEQYRKQHIDRIRNDFKHIQEWKQNTSKYLLIVGTHADFIPSFLSMDPKEALFNDNFQKYLEYHIPELTGPDIQNAMVGAFTTQEELKYYAKEIFKRLDSIKKKGGK